MAQQPNDLRERLLAALPQPENLVAYREETGALLAKHARALRWDKVAATTFAFLVLVIVSIWTWNPYHLNALALHRLEFLSGLTFLTAGIEGVRYIIYASQVATLKEIKQIQLQILELQAALRKE